MISRESLPLLLPLGVLGSLVLGPATGQIQSNLVGQTGIAFTDTSLMPQLMVRALVKLAALVLFDGF
jgi:hypothetical protein